MSSFNSAGGTKNLLFIGTEKRYGLKFFYWTSSGRTGSLCTDFECQNTSNFNTEIELRNKLCKYRVNNVCVRLFNYKVLWIIKTSKLHSETFLLITLNSEVNDNNNNSNYSNNNNQRGKERVQCTEINNNHLHDRYVIFTVFFSYNSLFFRFFF